MNNIEIGQRVFDADVRIEKIVHLASLNFDAQSYDIRDMIYDMEEEDCIAIFGEKVWNASNADLPDALHSVVFFGGKGGFLLRVERVVCDNFTFFENGEWSSCNHTSAHRVTHVYGDTFEEAIQAACDWSDAEFEEQVQEAKVKQ